MDTTQLVRQNFPIEYTPLSRGHIAGVVELVAGKPVRKASVTAFTDLLLIILPGASSEALYGPCKWGAIHGARLPAVGAEVQVGVDETNHPVVLWWEGEQKTTETPEAWKLLSSLTYKNSWEDFEGGARKGEYRKNPFGNVELRGVIKTGTSGTIAVTLPAGYRPKNAEAFVVRSAANTAATVEIGTGGEVIPTNIGGEVKTAVFFDGISFSVE